jgi:hypothetical protein
VNKNFSPISGSFHTQYHPFTELFVHNIVTGY